MSKQSELTPCNYYQECRCSYSKIDYSCEHNVRLYLSIGLVSWYDEFVLWTPR